MIIGQGCMIRNRHAGRGGSTAGITTYNVSKIGNRVEPITYVDASVGTAGIISAGARCF